MTTAQDLRTAQALVARQRDASASASTSIGGALAGRFEVIPSECPTHGPYMARRIRIRGALPSPCPACSKAVHAAGVRVVPVVVDPDIPARYTATLDTLAATGGRDHATAIAYMRALADPMAIQMGRGALLYGAVGSGKTELACAALRAVVRPGVIAKYLSFPDLIVKIKDAWRRSRDEPSVEELIDKLGRRVDILLLDDIGVGGEMAQTEQNTLYNIIDYRYSHRKPTVVTTNLGAGRDQEGAIMAIGAVVGRPTASRLEACCRVIRCDWASLRKVAFDRETAELGARHAKAKTNPSGIPQHKPTR
jgi:DNA replication protein DnaC